MDWLTQYAAYLEQGGPAAFVEFLGGFFTLLAVMRFLPEALKGFDALAEEDGLPRLLRGLVTVTLGIPIVYGAAIAAGSLVR